MSFLLIQNRHKNVAKLICSFFPGYSCKIAQTVLKNPAAALFSIIGTYIINVLLIIDTFLHYTTTLGIIENKERK